MADSSAFDVGDLVVVTVTVRNLRDEPSAATLTLRALPPGATTPQEFPMVPTVDADGAEVPGSYTARVPVTAPGYWNISAKADGALQGVRAGGFHVRTPKIA